MNSGVSSAFLEQENPYPNDDLIDVVEEARIWGKSRALGEGRDLSCDHTSAPRWKPEVCVLLRTVFGLGRRADCHLRRVQTSLGE